MRIALLHGVNLDLLGRRDPAHYGTLTLAGLEDQVRGWAAEHGLEATCAQTNHEGVLVERLHDAAQWASGILINPGAWTHYSYAIRDALEFCIQQGVVAVEVHLSDIEAREEFRRTSVIADIVQRRVTGRGPDGYRDAIAWLAGALREGETA